MILSCTILASLGVVLSFRQGSRASWVTGRKFVPKPGLVSWKRGDHTHLVLLHHRGLSNHSEKELSLHAMCKKVRHILKRLLLYINNLHHHLSSCSAAALSVKLEVMLVGRLAGRLPGASGRQSSPKEKCFLFYVCIFIFKGLCASYHPEIPIPLLAPHCYIHIRWVRFCASKSGTD